MRNIHPISMGAAVLLALGLGFVCRGENGTNNGLEPPQEAQDLGRLLSEWSGPLGPENPADTAIRKQAARQQQQLELWKELHNQSEDSEQILELIESMESGEVPGAALQEAVVKLSGELIALRKRVRDLEEGNTAVRIIPVQEKYRPR